MKRKKLFRIETIVLLLSGMVLCYSCRHDISLEESVNISTRSFGPEVLISFNYMYDFNSMIDSNLELDIIEESSFKIDGTFIDTVASDISYIEFQIDTDESFSNNWILRDPEGNGGDAKISPEEGTFTGEFGVFKGGEYIIRACMYMSSGTTYYSNIINLKANWPNTEEIKKAFSEQMKNTWNNLSNSVNNTGPKKEYGYYIYIKGGTIKPFENLDLRVGAEDYSCVSIKTVELEDDEFLTGPYDPDAKYIVAQFHTHPPLSDCPSNVSRRGGPSGVDLGSDARFEYPCFVYDYTGTVQGGHSLNIPAEIYSYEIEDRRVN